MGTLICVPVEPDYEAAKQRAKNIMLYIVSNPQMSGDEFDINVDTLVREVLQTALLMEGGRE